MGFKGPFIFYERGGAGGIWGGGGGHAKKNGFRGGAIPKKLGKKGGLREIF